MILFYNKKNQQETETPAVNLVDNLLVPISSELPEQIIIEIDLSIQNPYTAIGGDLL